MVENTEQTAWLTFAVKDTEGDGVDIPKLARLLERLSSSFYSIARTKIGAGEGRPGRRTMEEGALAGIRLVRIEPGSATIELAPPPIAAQGKLPISDEPTADDVAREFFEEVEQVEAGLPVGEGRLEIRRRVRDVVQVAGEIGSRAEIVFRPLRARPDVGDARVFRTSIRTRGIADEEAPVRSTRTRRISGHAFMVDVEPGRQRLRVKMPDGRDLTLEVHEDSMAKIRAALDQVVEVEVEEAYEGTVPAGRTARNVSVLPSSGPGSEQPPKSIAQLEREQRLPQTRPDYQTLASAIWETEEEVADFEEHLREVRRAETG